DISILRLTPGVGEGGTDFFQVLSTAGDTHLGGDDVDRMLLEVFLRDVAARGTAEVSAGARQALRDAAETAKCRLSEVEETAVGVSVDGREFRRVVTRGELEGLASAWVERTIAACERALRDAKRHLEGGRDARAGGEA